MSGCAPAYWAFVLQTVPEASLSGEGGESAGGSCEWWHQPWERPSGSGVDGAGCGNEGAEPGAVID